jgi:hypothetical protein
LDLVNYSKSLSINGPFPLQPSNSNSTFFANNPRHPVLMSFSVYTVEYLGKPNHIAIFVENGSNGSGTLYHVVGTILQGMTFEKKNNTPDQSATYVKGSKTLIGHVKSDQMGQFEIVCRSIPVPGAQMTLGGKLKDPSKPLRRCGDWVNEVTNKLIAEGLVKCEFDACLERSHGSNSSSRAEKSEKSVISFHILVLLDGRGI